MIELGKNGKPATGIDDGVVLVGFATGYATTPFVVPTKTNGKTAAKHLRAPAPPPPQPMLPSETWNAAAWNVYAEGAEQLCVFVSQTAAVHAAVVAQSV